MKVIYDGGSHVIATGLRTECVPSCQVSAPNSGDDCAAFVLKLTVEFGRPTLVTVLCSCSNVEVLVSGITAEMAGGGVPEGLQGVVVDVGGGHQSRLDCRRAPVRMAGL
ncbi:hypothetical protein M5K25_007659 [Dendrobium thyrsiflorum]|uniref:Uncharacterized protein n=1 Tax=Dendrobium thyrsiflorum TaxID=117978 RepID=A0ABD0VF07_DENTH